MSIEAFDLRTAHLFGDAMFQQARLRYDVFVKRRELDHPYYNGLEYDQFDTPGAVYIIWRDERRVVRGLVRLLPTTLPYMLETLWPELMQSGQFPRRRDVWEVTRVCVDHTLPGRIRRSVLPALFSGVEEFGRHVGISSYLCVTRPYLIEHVLRKGLRQLGPVLEIEGEMEAAFEVSQQEMSPSYYCDVEHSQRPRLNTAIRLEEAA